MERRKTILVVEDDELVRMGIAEELVDQGYAVLEASNADEALTTLRSEDPIDLLITDIGLPGMDGRQLAGEARGLRPTLKVLFLTGYREEADTGDGAWSKTVEKPVEMRVLAKLVKDMSRSD